MKSALYITTGILILLFTATCSNNKEKEGIEITGTIQQQGITSYQYGTHTLTNNESFYAIKSDSLDLNEYLNKEVTVRAEKIEGYPLEGGPEYLQILEVKEVGSGGD